MQVTNKDEAFNFVDTRIRQHWLELAKQNEFLSGLKLGQATIEQEAEFDGHKVWQFHFEGLPATMDARRQWIVDTGEIIETTLNDDENTLEKAYAKLQRVQIFNKKAAKLLGVKTEDLAIAEADEIGLRFYEPIRDGRSIILGNDDGVLFANSSVNPEDHIQAYKDGKRTSQKNFAKPNVAISEEQVKKFVQDKFNETAVSDRIEDRGFAYYINTQPREYLDALDEEDISKMTIGNGPLVVIKDTGEVFVFSSNPTHMFGNSGDGIGVNSAETSEEFQKALSALRDANDYSALHPKKLEL